VVQTRAVEDAAFDIPKVFTGRGHGCGKVLHANPTPPPQRAPVNIEDLLATQNELMRVLMHNKENHGVERLQHHKQYDMNPSYSDIPATHPPVFSRAKDPLDAGDWFYTTKPKFGLLHSTEYQKTLYAA
jgi:hypothetical protein